MKKYIITALIVLILAAISKPSKESFSNLMNSTIKVNKNDNLISSIVKPDMNFQSDLSTQ